MNDIENFLEGKTISELKEILETIEIISEEREAQKNQLKKRSKKRDDKLNKKKLYVPLRCSGRARKISNRFDLLIKKQKIDKANPSDFYPKDFIF